MSAPREPGQPESRPPGVPDHSAPLADPRLEARFHDAFLDIWLGFACSGDAPWPPRRTVRPRPAPPPPPTSADLASRLRSLARALQRAVEEGRPGPL
ncbi:hypothetical protein NI17_004020 [Thermobifida halotolerans]|uniref:Uncharacterized protein n=1 Tax=Thermobifida halotolerans TaxID=483545 RepID=A0AA97M4S7_9ACTN|nr:hypothetical protein [Thermobifida halotolerans]UOE20411.1 hypothetical protein NI17_004020 [Thermobifida halotolerans]